MFHFWKLAQRTKKKTAGMNLNVINRYARRQQIAAVSWVELNACANPEKLKDVEWIEDRYL